jgi:uncharacterized protein (TIRG00374 family)
VAIGARRSLPRQLGWLVVLVALGGVGIWIAAPEPDTLRTAWSRVGDAPLAALAALTTGAVGLVLAEALRIRVIGRVLGAHVRWRDAADAAVANQVMTAVTPTVGLGEPSVAYVLRRRGVALDAAIAIPFIKFTTSLALVFALGSVLVVAGHGPAVGGLVTAAGLAVFVAIAAGASAFVIVCAHPLHGSRLVETVCGWLARRRLLARPRWQARVERLREVGGDSIARLAALRGSGVSGVAALIAVHLVYYAAYVLPIVLLAVLLADPPLAAIAMRAVVFLCFMFAVPTPGGAGGTEAAAGLFFSDLIPLADALVVVAVFRAATFYLHLAIGLIYVPARALGRS